MQYASGGRLTDFCSKKSLLFSVLLLRLYTFSNTFECPLPYILKNLFIHLHLLRYIMEICQFGEELSASIEVLHYSCCINLNLLISLSATNCESGAKSKINIYILYIYIHIYIYLYAQKISRKLKLCNCCRHYCQQLSLSPTLALVRLMLSAFLLFLFLLLLRLFFV